MDETRYSPGQPTSPEKLQEIEGLTSAKEDIASFLETRCLPNLKNIDYSLKQTTLGKSEAWHETLYKGMAKLWIEIVEETKNNIEYLGHRDETTDPELLRDYGPEYYALSSIMHESPLAFSGTNLPQADEPLAERSGVFPEALAKFLTRVKIARGATVDEGIPSLYADASEKQEVRSFLSELEETRSKHGREGAERLGNERFQKHLPILSNACEEFLSTIKDLPENAVDTATFLEPIKQAVDQRLVELQGSDPAS